MKIIRDGINYEPDYRFMENYVYRKSHPYTAGWYVLMPRTNKIYVNWVFCHIVGGTVPNVQHKFNFGNFSWVSPLNNTRANLYLSKNHVTESDLIKTTTVVAPLGGIGGLSGGSCFHARSFEFSAYVSLNSVAGDYMEVQVCYFKM